MKEWMNDWHKERRRKEKKRKEGIRTVIGCIAIFRLPMTECDLESTRTRHTQRLGREKGAEKGDGAREAKG